MARRFPESITLSGDEALDLLASVEEAIWQLTDAGRYDAAMALTDGRLVLLDKLTGEWPGA